jgi:superfamily II DNA helicase RecQ
MLDQVAHLQSLGINAVAVYADQDPKVLEEVEEGIYSHVYISPESMLSHQRWRKMLESPTFQEHCVVVAVDEAHCISHWSV